MLFLHRADRADRLLDALADVLRAADDPFAEEVVAVPSRGIERWLAQELSGRLGAQPGRGDGVCAHVDFPFPSRVLTRAVAAGWVAATGEPPPLDRHGEPIDPWSPSRLVWTLLDVVDVHRDGDWLAPVRQHLLAPDDADDTRRGRRFSALRHVADLYDRYALHRPDMIRAWDTDRSPAADPGPDGRPLDEHNRWQAILWRHARDALRPAPSPTRRADVALDAIRAGATIADLPSRLSFFDLTALPTGYVAVLDALAVHRDVHLFLLHPSPALWERVRALGPALTSAGATAPPRDQDPTRELPRNPLSASWGRDARELQVVLSGTAATDLLHGADPAPATLLERLQADVRHDREPPGPPVGEETDTRPALDPADRSVQVHACHGRTRQVEVLRDAVLHLLAGDPTLEPRDILVMCPDIEEFAPLVHAVFGAHVAADDLAREDDPTAASGGADRGLPDLRVRLADRALRQTNPVLRVVAELLELAESRVTAPQVLDLATREPVRRRFRFDDHALSRMEDWVSVARIRWGLDGDHRAMFDLADVTANTWRAGLDRILLGVAMADEDERLVGDTVPVDDVEGTDAEIAGRFAEFVDRLAAVLRDLRDPRPVEDWRRTLADAADLLSATGPSTRWQAVQLHRILDEVVAEATRADGVASTVPLTLEEVRSLLDDRLRGRPSRANHRTGDLTVATLVPMRSVPHRVICLLGMDDGAFPRHGGADGDDLTDADPRVGDRDPRTEDRQLLLDALLAATDTLVVTYTGHDERTNEALPPAVPIGELLDVVDRTVRVDGSDRPASTQVVVEHPLQPFDPRNFRPGALRPDGAWSFDRVALGGARRLATGEPSDPGFLSDPLPPPADGDAPLELDDLVAFVEHPAKAFLRQRLGVYLPSAVEEASDAMPVDPGPLERWDVGDRLLHARLAGVDLARWTEAERRRGTLPPGELADAMLADIAGEIDAMLTAAAEEVDLDAPRTAVEVHVTLPGGRTVVGVVTDVVGDRVLAVRYSRLKAKHRLAAWARLLALTATDPERAWRTVTVGRSGGSGTRRTALACAGPLDVGAGGRAQAAARELALLLDLYDRGMRAPVPVYCQTSAEWVEALARDRDPDTAALKEWTTKPGSFPREDRDPEHVLTLGGVVPLTDLLTEPPRPDERDGWPAADHRFGAYALRLWQPLLAHEQVDER